ncbi:MAG: hypothetical protein NTV51_16915 [Verrucomicrobia bacterium]|nr:hypothetical protein [Verrucomicrobiota bacterium]
MNTHSVSVLFAGEMSAATLRDGSTVAVRVRELPVRHHLELLELFHIGREADLIQRCTERRTAPSASACAPGPTVTSTSSGGSDISDSAPPWQPVDATFVDSLTDESHVALADLAQALNFSRAIRTAQRQIARGQTLQPVLTAMTQAIMEPMRREFASWSSSLTSQLSAASDEKPR